MQRFLFALVLTAMLPTFTLAQSLFSKVVSVNTDAITRFEVSQRENLFRAMNRQGNLNKMAIDSLIDERLQLQAARSIGLRVTEEGLEAGLNDFAERAGFELDDLIAFFASNGVDPSSFRSYVEAQLTWREVVRAKFAGQAQVSEAEIDRAANATGPSGGLQVALSEIVLYAPPEFYDAQMEVAKELSQITSITRFATEARARSAAQSAQNGGRLEWTQVKDLPPALRGILTSLRPGQTTQPLEVENAIIVFQLRDIAETAQAAPTVTAVEYARITVPQNEVATITAQLDVCDDFYGVAKRLGNDSLTLETVPPAQVPTPLAASLASMDPFEITTVNLSETATQITMLCGRSTQASDAVSREDIAGGLRQRRLESLADGYLAELTSAAKIVRH
ncbi:MAG: peptidylprolyl isomerase [Planktomarina sp.]